MTLSFVVSLSTIIRAYLVEPVIDKLLNCFGKAKRNTEAEQEKKLYFQNVAGVLIIILKPQLIRKEFSFILITLQRETVITSTYATLRTPCLLMSSAHRHELSFADSKPIITDRNQLSFPNIHPCLDPPPYPSLRVIWKVHSAGWLPWLPVKIFFGFCSKKVNMRKIVRLFFTINSIDYKDELSSATAFVKRIHHIKIQKWRHWYFFICSFWSGF